MSYRNILYALGPKQELTPGASITWAFDGRPAVVDISVNGTLTVTGPIADFPMVGLLKVTHTVAGTTLTLAGDSSNVVWSTGAGQHTILEFVWDGTEYVWTSRTKSATAALTQLPIPSDFAATGNSATEMGLSWTDVSGETGYEIQHASEVDYSDAALLSSPAAGATSATDTGLTADLTKYYRIRAIGDGTTTSNSAWSAWVTGTTLSAAGYLTEKRITAELTYDGATGTLTKSGGGVNDWYNEFAANETCDVGESVVFQIPVIAQSVYVALGTDANQPYFTSGGQANSLRYGLQTNGDGNIYEITNGAAPNNAPIANNIYLKIEYADASTVKYYKSVDGASWTLIFTSGTGVVASSVFYIYAYIKTPGATITNLQRV